MFPQYSPILYACWVDFQRKSLVFLVRFLCLVASQIDSVLGGEPKVLSAQAWILLTILSILLKPLVTVLVGPAPAVDKSRSYATLMSKQPG